MTLFLLRPPILLISLLPFMLDIPELLLDALHGCLVARIFAHVITEFDGGPAVGGGDLDDDVQGLRFLSVRFVGEIICFGVPGVGSSQFCGFQWFFLLLEMVE